MDKTAESVAKFLYDDIICRHGCPEIQISDQGREFLNKLSNELFRLTGTQQRVTSPYHPQANGLVERLNRTLKTSLLKVILFDVIYITFLYFYDYKLIYSILNLLLLLYKYAYFYYSFKHDNNICRFNRTMY